MRSKSIGVILSVMIGIAAIGLVMASNLVQDSPDKSAGSLDTVNLLLGNKENVLVIDIRTPEQYQAGHLKGASHDVLDSATIEKRVNTMQSKLPDVAAEYNLVLVDNDGVRAKQVAQTMTDMGIQTFYLDGGMRDMTENLVTSSQSRISSKELSYMLESEDLYLLDVRQPEELAESKIDGAVNIPLADIFQPNGMASIPTDKPVVVICGSGNRATIASYALAQEGIDFRILEGGMASWDSQIPEEKDM